jgi:hypothetical protein
MTDPISPIGPVGATPGVRRVSRRAVGQDEAVGSASEPGGEDEARLPVIAEPAPAPPPPRSRRAALAAFAAHLMGQGGQKRGLRGGPETLDKARNAYLETEWSGPADRRLRSGKITKTEI